MNKIKIIVERHPDGYVAYPLGIEGVVVGERETHDGALGDLKSAMRFHVETFGEKTLEVDPPILEASVEETIVEL